MQVMCYVSKCHALRNFLQRSYVGVWIPLQDIHNVHVYTGK